MTDFRISTYKSYLSAWSAVPDQERMRLLHEGVTDGIVFKNATRSRRGVADLADHLCSFQDMRPGGSFRLLAMLAWEEHALATWQFVDAEGEPRFIGYDALTFSNDDRIDAIVMFTKVEPHILM